MYVVIHCSHDHFDIICQVGYYGNLLVDASEILNGSRVEAYAKGDIRQDVICLIFA